LQFYSVGYKILKILRWGVAMLATLALYSWAEVIFPPQPSKQLGLQACTTHRTN
jgi:hypothetical protein